MGTFGFQHVAYVHTNTADLSLMCECFIPSVWCDVIFIDKNN